MVGAARRLRVMAGQRRRSPPPRHGRRRPTTHDLRCCFRSSRQRPNSSGQTAATGSPMTATGRPYPMRDSNDPTPAAVIDPPPRRTSWQRLGAAGSATRQASILTTGGELATGKPYIERLEHNPGALDRIADALLGITFRPARGLLHDPARS